MELEQINFILSLLLIATGLVVGSCFLLLSAPQIKELQNYRIARITMGVAYILLALSMISEFMLPPTIKPDVNMVRIIILTISPILALSFTYTSLSLINICFSVKQRLMKEIIPVCVISCLNWIAFFTTPVWVLYIFQGIFILYYIFILFKYTSLFYTTFEEYKQQMDNYFSEQEWKRLRWVNFSFYYALVVGIMALISILSPGVIFVFFKIFVIPFYVYYGFQLINYGFKYQSITLICISSDKNENTNNNINIRSASYNDLEFLIEEWITQKGYLKAGVTIEQIAGELNTNRTYLSNYINTYKNQTFREWINLLRIDEAKRLMLENQTLPVNEIGKMVGFNDKSNFTRQFIKVTGNSPSKWKGKM